MDFGLYTLKYPFRKLIQGMLPLFAQTNPNSISFALLPLGVVIACTYYYAPTYSALYLLGILLIFLRLVIATLDGLVAVTYEKSSPYGELLNRAVPEVADMMLLLALVINQTTNPVVSFFVLVVSWAISFTCLIGLVCGGPVQSVGPTGQTDRLVTLMIFSLLQYLSARWSWGFEFIPYGFFIWLIVGGVVTLALRWIRTTRFARSVE